MVKSKKEAFSPDVAVPPGETTRENLECLGMSQEELAVRLGLSTKQVSLMLNGRAALTYETAIGLELAIGASAAFWMQLEANYRIDLLRLEESKRNLHELEMLRQFPYSSMFHFGWIQYERSSDDKIRVLRQFFGVADLNQIEASYEPLFRRNGSGKMISDLSVLSWLRKVDLEARSIHTATFSLKKLRESLPCFKSLTMKMDASFFVELQTGCAACGIALVLVQSLPGTRICGATIWRNGKAIVALTARGKKADIFWFTFFHEMAHLLEQSGRASVIHFQDAPMDAEEQADILAANILLPSVKYEAFLADNRPIDEARIREMALVEGIAPYILLGRLQHDGHVPFASFRSMKPSYTIIPETVTAAHSA